MNRLIALVVILCLLLPQIAFGMSIHNSLGAKFSSNRVIVIVGVIDEAMTASVAAQLRNSSGQPGPVVVDIQSPGGSVAEGKKIIKLLEAERSRSRLPLVCVVERAAHSMAFSILTHCDIRLATADSVMVVHKVALGGDPGVRLSAKNLRTLADEMDKEDAPMAEENRRAMHLSAADYDKYADEQRAWTTPELMKMHYLNGVVTVSE